MKKIALNTFIPLLLQIVTIISGFIIPRLILSHYGSQINGLVNSITHFLSIISFMEMGIGNVVRYNFYKPLVSKDHYQLSCIYVSAKRYYRLIARVLIVYILFLIVIYPRLVNSQVDAQFSIVLILIISITSFSQYYFGQINQILLMADQKSYFSSSIHIASIIIYTLLSAALINKGASIYVVKASTAAVFSIKPVLLHFYVKKHYCIDEKVEYEGEPIQQKWNGIAQHVSTVVLEQTDVLVLTGLSTLINVSIYSVYHLVINGIKMLIFSMTNGIEPYIGALIAEDNKNKLQKTFSVTEWVLHTFTTLIFSCTIVLIVPFVMVYTRDVNDANYNVPLFAFLITIANAGHCLRLPYSIAINAAGHYRQTQSNYIISAALNLVVSVLLVARLGLIGVAIGTIVAMSYQTVWMAGYTYRNIISGNFRSFLKQLLVDAVSMMLIVHFSKGISASDNYVAWIIAAIKCVLISAAIIIPINMILYRDRAIGLVQKILKW